MEMRLDEFCDLCIACFMSGKPLAAHETEILSFLEQRAEESSSSFLLSSDLKRILSEITHRAAADREYIYQFLPKAFFEPEQTETGYMVRDLTERLLRLDRLIKLLSRIDDERSDQICRFLAEHVDENLSIGQVARHFYMNRKYMSTYIRIHLGTIYSHYQRQIRMERARKLLSDGGMKVYEVADLLGFRDVEYFSRLFRQSSGQIPKEYVWHPNDDCPIQEQYAAGISSEIRVGIVGAYSGEYAYLDGGKRYIYEMAAEEINAGGGICGKPIRLIYKDYCSDLSKVRHVIQELESENVDVVIGGYLSSAREIIRHFIDEKKMLYLYDSLYEGGIADHYTFVFSSMPEQNLFPVIKHLFQQGCKRYYILATDYNYGILSCEYAKYYIRELGGVVAATEYVPNSKSDFSVTIENIRVHAPEVVVTFLVGERQSEFFSQWHENGDNNLAVITTSAIPQGYMHLTTKKGVLENVYFSAPYTEELETAASLKWRRKVREKYSGEQIPYLGCDHEAAYLTLHYYKAAVERAGSFDVRAVIRALESGKIWIEAPGGYSFMNPYDHHLVRDVGIYRIDRENRVVQMENVEKVKSEFVERMLQNQFGVRGGLRELGRNAPNLQYNPMLYSLY